LNAYAISRMSGFSVQRNRGRLVQGQQESSQCLRACDAPLHAQPTTGIKQNAKWWLRSTMNATMMQIASKLL